MSVYHHGDTGEDGRVLFRSVHGLLRKGATVDTMSVEFSSQLHGMFPDTEVFPSSEVLS